jgi:D-alanyl-D-alanine carboxypeptidase
MRASLKKNLIIVAVGFATHGVASYHINNFSILEQDIKAGPSMHVGMMVMDPDTGKTIYQYQAQQYFHPASNAKLFTAISAHVKSGCQLSIYHHTL